MENFHNSIKANFFKQTVPATLITVSITLLTSLFSFAQVTQEWLKRYDVANTSDIATAMATDNADGIYVTGSGGALGNTDIVTIKYDTAGHVIWTRIWNGPGNSYDGANAIIVKGNALYITGFTESPPQINSNRRKDFATLKYDLNGTLLWSAYYNFSPTNNWEDIAYAIDVDQQNNVFVTGSSKSASPQVGYRDIATIKYNSSGVQQWVVRYNAFSGTNDDIPVALHVDPSGNVLVTGNSIGINSGVDYVTLKYSSSGVNLWERRYTMPGNYNDSPYAMKVDDSSNVYVTGASSAYAIDPSIWYDYATIKYNSNGDTVWVRRFNSGATAVPWDEARDLVVDDTENVYVTGSVPSTIPNTYGDDFYTLKYNAAGTLLWQSRWDWLGFEDQPYKMKLDANNNIYITGISTSPNANLNYATIKLNNSGVVQWFQTYQGPNGSEHIAHDIILDKKSDVYVTGQSYGTSDDYVTIKYLQAGASCSGPPAAVISAAGSTTFCKGENVALSSAVTGSPVTYQWKKAGNNINGATSDNFLATEGGSYTLSVTNDCGTTISNTITLTMKNLPKANITPSGTVTMCQGSTTLLTANTGNNLSYQWMKGSTNIAGATGSTYAATAGGKFKVIVTNDNSGCSRTSEVTKITITCKEEMKYELASMSVYPNPSSEEFTIELQEEAEYDLMVYDLLGKGVFSFTNASGSFKFGKELSDGVYLVRVESDNRVIQTIKIIKNTEGQ